MSWCGRAGRDGTRLGPLGRGVARLSEAAPGGAWRGWAGHGMVRRLALWLLVRLGVMSASEAEAVR